MPQARTPIIILALIVLIRGLLSSPLVYADPTDDIRQLADAGAVNLAIRVLDSNQARAGNHAALWQKFEKQRIALYRDRHDWEKISARLANLPKFVSSAFRQWAGEQRAQALIELGQGDLARSQLRHLIWSNKTLTPVQLSGWRKLIIRSYLGDGLAGDAQMAVMRFRQDYPRQAKKDYLLRARILLLNENYAEAIALLKPHASDPTAGSLLLLAQLRGQTRPPRKVLEATYRHLREKGIDATMTANLWAVAAEAAEHADKRGSVALALEHVMIQRKAVSLPNSIIDPGVDDLWNAYIDYAVAISNRQQLLIGQDHKWLVLAGGLKKKKPVASRSLYAFVMLRGQSQAARNKAAKAFMKSISQRKHGDTLLQVLFEKSKYFKHRNAIPANVRPRLVDLALARGKIDLASEIMATIKKPPAGEDQFMWLLRRARILVLGNQLKLGEQALMSLLDATPKMEQVQVDRFMQVIFDLQTAGENDAAYNLFAKVMKHTDDQKTRREIFYWMADSRRAQKRYINAAQLYLKSAMYPDPRNMDPWSQTAHYQAAVVLAKAGLYQDAQTLLRRLLKVTKNPERREALQRELQKMWAMQ
ncbi:MAG: hypothetical protein P8Z75_09815 [Gammaproteobacteria bacterium]